MAERVEFKRNIGLFMAVMIGIGAMMGPGIFALPGELAVLAGFAVLGAARVEPANLTPFAPLDIGPFPSAMALICISYVGFELITVASEEIIAPGKTTPRAILITLGVGTVIYVAVGWVMMGAVPCRELGQTDVPFISAADRLFGAWGQWAAITATIMASLSAFSVTPGASARVLCALGRDGHFPRRLAQLHRRFHTPHVALAVCALLVVAFSSSGIVKLVASISDFGYLIGLGIVNLSVIAVVQDPDYVPLLEGEGIVALSAPWVTAAMVENVLDRPGVADLFEIGSGVASLVSVTVPKNSHVASVPIRGYRDPEGARRGGRDPGQEARRAAGRHGGRGGRPGRLRRPHAGGQEGAGLVPCASVEQEPEAASNEMTDCCPPWPLGEAA